ncbi:Potassium transporter TrkA [Rhodovastum atsumiense]|uniref:Potassium transporter TrkA n=1 Tax=Rhodovastum atsumiense TaxID=504468 RepID=A0A5M6IKQ8_9PROT|nr:cation:proton antiporter [Rhodovastum atsumiense]KAA5608497.1 potassium transporter TrkA [Rhodovastum atsumiense]CAH2599285.1 Potassium transporter TrkA [Rhodovastum atsumiense]
MTEGPANPAALKEVLIVLGAAGVVIPLFHRLRVSPVLGFMLVGMVVGPFGLGRVADLAPWVGWVTIANAEAIAPIAGFGVVLLLFMIGLELSFERLWVMRRLVFGLGAAQVAMSTTLLAGVGLLAGMDPAGAVVVGLAGAMSSTAVVIQVLSEERRLATLLGRLCFSVLLFQDIAVVPILVALGLQGTGPEGGPGMSLWLAVTKAVLSLGAIVGLGRLGLRPLFRSVARTRSPEFFMAACLLVVIATALAASAAGLSPALGALVAGLLLAGTEFRREIEVTIDPFKGLALGVFLISVGLQFDPVRLVSDPLGTLGGAATLVLLNGLLIAPLTRLFGAPWSVALQAGLLLGPGGEFSLVLLGIAAGEGLVERAAAEQALLAVALSMAAIPLLSAVGRRQVQRLVATPKVIDPALLPPDTVASGPRVIVAGFGRVGQMVASMLQAHAVPYVAIDRDPDRVARERHAGQPVYWGDIGQPALMRRLGIGTARALVVTMDERSAVDTVVAVARAERPDLLIVARARDAAHAAHLYHGGVSDAVPETVEASLQLSEAVLVDIGVPMGPVIASIHEKRAEIQAVIKAAAPQAEIRTLGRRRLRDARRREEAREG